MTTTDNSRADALTKLRREAIRSGIAALEKLGWTYPAGVLRNMLAASPVEQPAAAPTHSPECEYIKTDNPWAACTCGIGSPNNPAPSPADERAAFEWPLLPLLPETVITTADGEAVFTAHQMQGYANAYGEMVRARAASANETGAWLQRTVLEIADECGISGEPLARLAHVVDTRDVALLHKLTTPIVQTLRASANETGVEGATALELLKLVADWVGTDLPVGLYKRVHATLAEHRSDSN